MSSPCLHGFFSSLYFVSFLQSWICGVFFCNDQALGPMTSVIAEWRNLLESIVQTYLGIGCYMTEILFCFGFFWRTSFLFWEIIPGGIATLVRHLTNTPDTNRHVEAATQNLSLTPKYRLKQFTVWQICQHMPGTPIYYILEFENK